jgi:hypothetical protein
VGEIISESVGGIIPERRAASVGTSTLQVEHRRMPLLLIE